MSIVTTVRRLLPADRLYHLLLQFFGSLGCWWFTLLNIDEHLKNEQILLEVYVKIRVNMLRIWGVGWWKFCRKIGCSGRGHVKENNLSSQHLVVKHATLAAMLAVPERRVTGKSPPDRNTDSCTHWVRPSQLTSKENHHYPIQCLGNDTFQYFNIDPAVGFPRFSYIYFFKPKYHTAWTGSMLRGVQGYDNDPDFLVYTFLKNK